MKTRTIRIQLREAIKTDADFDAFCIDYFPETYRKFGHSQNRVEKENILFAEQEQHRIASALSEISIPGSVVRQPVEPTTIEHAPLSFSGEVHGAIVIGSGNVINNSVRDNTCTARKGP